MNGPRRAEVPSRHLAVKAEPHESTRAQDRQKDPPSDHRLGKMMQDAAGFDDVERAANRAKLQHISLRILDVFKPSSRVFRTHS